MNSEDEQHEAALYDVSGMLNTSCGAGARQALALVGEIRPDQGAEEHALRAQEDPHAHLPVVEPRVADVWGRAPRARSRAPPRRAPSAPARRVRAVEPMAKQYISAMVTIPNTTTWTMLIMSPRDHQRDRQAEQDRPVRRRRHVDRGDVLGGWRHAARGYGLPPCPSPCFSDPEVVALVDRRDHREVVDGRRRGDRPLQRAPRPTGRGPRSRRCAWSVTHVDDEHQRSTARSSTPRCVDTMFQKSQPRSGA